MIQELDKYIDLPGHPGLKACVKCLDGQPPPGWPQGDRELIAFATSTSPRISDIVDAERKIHAALKDLAFKLIVGWEAPNVRGEVILFHSTFVKIEIWCPVGAAQLLGIKEDGK